jgi:hypothetical protein
MACATRPRGRNRSLAMGGGPTSPLAGVSGAAITPLTVVHLSLWFSKVRRLAGDYDKLADRAARRAGGEVPRGS